MRPGSGLPGREPAAASAARDAAQHGGMVRTPRESKPCAHCGRPFENRKRWDGREQWDAVRYCSRACRSAAARERRRA